MAQIAKEQDEKINSAVSDLKHMIQQVANAPVQVSLSEAAKKEIVKGLENRVAALERRV
jgi:hypothetical protein